MRQGKLCGVFEVGGLSAAVTRLLNSAPPLAQEPVIHQKPFATTTKVRVTNHRTNNTAQQAFTPCAG